MIQVKDFALDANSDLVIENGDFVLEFSDNTHIEHIIAANTGYYKESPTVGVGIKTYLKTAGTAAEIERLISIQLEADRYLLDEVKVAALPSFQVSVIAKRIS